MRTMIRTALIVGTLATPMIAMADTPAKKDAPAAKDEGMQDPPKADADAPKDDAKKDVKKPAPKTTTKKTTKKAPTTDTTK